ncbi:MAG: hypothetical protein EBU90_08250 [Proteobacteria bacterium]|nr:hypothetical protein [Pseudomonadota bacterium]NBP15633.1 hypothetical protein [bacterium]
MPSLVNEIEKNNLTPLIEDLFDTFARDIVIHKEPKKIINSININSLAGYDETSNIENYEYILESKTFKAKIKYENNQELKNINNLGGLNSLLSQGVVKMKVRKDARDYILDGRKTEKIEFDGKSFNIISDESVKKFFNTTYYVFYLQATK